MKKLLIISLILVSASFLLARQEGNLTMWLVDNVIFRDNGNRLKRFRFEASGITSGHIRLYNAPDANGTLALIEGGPFTEGSVPFADSDGVLIQDNANIFFDDGNDLFIVNDIRVSVGDVNIVSGNLTGSDNFTVGNADNNFQFHADVSHITTPVGIQFGIGITPTQALTIGSNDGTQKIEIYHYANNAHFRWDDGVLQLQTDEGTNSITEVYIKGKGTGYGLYRVYDEDDAEFLTVFCVGGRGFIQVAGASKVALDLQNPADIPIWMFSGSSEGETQELQIYGFRTGDVKRSLEIGVGIDAADTASFDGLSNYRFDGNIIFGATGKGLSYGTISVVSNANETTITSQNVYVQVTVFDTNGVSNNVTPDHANDHITITKAGDYKIECCITANSVSGAGSTFEFEVKKNNGASRVGSAHGDRTLSGGGSEAGSITICTIATLAVDDTIELWTKNETNTQNIIIEDASLSVLLIGG